MCMEQSLNILVRKVGSHAMQTTCDADDSYQRRVVQGRKGACFTKYRTV